MNDIDDEQWALIRRHDSLGFNYWALHDFVPTFLFFETPVTPLNSSPLIVDTLIARSADYRRTPVVLKDVQCPGNYYQALDRLARHFPGNLYLALKRKIPGSRPDTLAKGLRYLEYLGEFEVDRPLRRLFQRQGTLSCAVLFGVKLGYKTIVLCGIDLNNTSYFFEEESAYYEDKGLRIPPNMNIAGRHKVHRTFDATLNPLTIDKVLAVIDTVLLSPRGIGLFVASRRSALYPRIPAFF